jgi:hypothetical protein
MANRYIRNAAILAKIETTYGTDPVPTGAANAMLVSNMSITPLNATNVGRDLVRNYFGGSEQLVGVRNIQVSFDIEAAGSGTAGTAPAYGPLLRACGMAETLTASNRADYLPVSSSFESVTIYWYDDGVLHKAVGARGSFQLMLNLGERPVFRFSFTGIYAAPTAASLPTTTLTSFQKPLVVNDTNTGDVTLGCTYATGSLSGGTTYPSRGLSLDLGAAVSHIPLLGAESVDITGREVTGSFQLDLTAAQEVTFAGTVTDNTTQSVGLVHGSTAGNILVVHAPAAQLVNYSKQEINGKRLIGYDLRLVPSSGNDELRLCFK